MKLRACFSFVFKQQCLNKTENASYHNLKPFLGLWFKTYDFKLKTRQI